MCCKEIREGGTLSSSLELLSTAIDKATPWTSTLMAMLCDVHYHRLLPAEEEVPCARPGRYSNAEVPIVGHEDEHEEVADDHLDDVQHCLQEVREAQHLLPDSFVCLHKDGSIWSWDGHGIVPDADLGLAQEALSGYLESFIEHG